MKLEDLDQDELVVVNIEQVKDVKKWIPFLLELQDDITSIHEDRLVVDDESDFMDKQGDYTVEIICSVGEFIELAPRIRELDDSIKDEMLSVRRTYEELEDFYYDYDEEE